MPLPRPLLQLCGLLLVVFAVTAAHAAAPPYGPNEVEVTITATPGSTTRHEQNTTCRASGGALLPMVTNTVYLAAFTYMDSSNILNAVGYMGSTTLQSPATCTTGKLSLDCIWHWEEGRYAGEGNALAFFKGNRHPDKLSGAQMVSELVGNYWRTSRDANELFPGSHMLRYGMAIRTDDKLGWADSVAHLWSYGNTIPTEYYTFCAIDMSTSKAPTPSTTTTTTDPNARKIMGLSVGAIVGIAAGGAVAVGLIIALVACLACNGCCCSAGSTAMADTASQRGDMSRANSCRSRHSGYGDFSNRSFHDGAAGKDGYSRRCSFHGSVGAAEAEMRQNDYEMASVAGSHYSRAASGAYGSWAPPPRTPSQVMLPVPPLEMMPMQPDMMMQPQPPMPMHGNWHM